MPTYCPSPGARPWQIDSVDCPWMEPPRGACARRPPNNPIQPNLLVCPTARGGNHIAQRFRSDAGKCYHTTVSTVPVLADPHSPSACDIASGVSALQRCIGPAASAATAIGKAGKGGRGGASGRTRKGTNRKKKIRKEENKRAVRKFSLCRLELHPDGAGHEMLHIFSPSWW